MRVVGDSGTAAGEGQSWAVRGYVLLQDPSASRTQGRSVPTALHMWLGLSTWPQIAGITKRLSGLFHPNPVPLVSQTGPYWCTPCLHLL